MTAVAVLGGSAGCRPADRLSDRPAVQPTPPPATAAPASAAGLEDRVWVRTDAGAPLGDLRIFLSDGTLVVDSCWEVYALRRWRRVSPDEIVLVEDVEIPARIVVLGADELRLSLALADGTRQEVAYRPGRAPFVCPEMRR